MYWDSIKNAECIIPGEVCDHVLLYCTTRIESILASVKNTETLALPNFYHKQKIFF